MVNEWGEEAPGLRGAARGATLRGDRRCPRRADKAGADGDATGVDGARKRAKGPDQLHWRRGCNRVPAPEGGSAPRAGALAVSPSASSAPPPPGLNPPRKPQPCVSRVGSGRELEGGIWDHPANCLAQRYAPPSPSILGLNWSGDARIRDVAGCAPAGRGQTGCRVRAQHSCRHFNRGHERVRYAVKEDSAGHRGHRPRGQGGAGRGGAAAAGERGVGVSVEQGRRPAVRAMRVPRPGAAPGVDRAPPHSLAPPRPGDAETSRRRAPSLRSGARRMCYTSRPSWAASSATCATRSNSTGTTSK